MRGLRVQRDAYFGLVRARGRADTTFALEPGHEDPGNPLLLEAPPEARVTVRVLRDDGRPAEGVPVEVELDAYRLSPPTVVRVFPGTVRWSATTSSTGSCELATLPPDTEIRVFAFTRLGLDPDEFIELSLDGRSPQDCQWVTPSRDEPLSIELVLPSR